MIKSNILTAVLLVVVIGAAVAVHTRSSAQAQATGAHRWEYCGITSVSMRSRSEADHQFESFAVITYYGTAGSRNEELVGEVGSDGNAALRAASGKAITKLGADGWEIVGNENINLDSNPEHVGGLLFKRPR